jgi:hypothetical protein
LFKISKKFETFWKFWAFLLNFFLVSLFKFLGRDIQISHFDFFVYHFEAFWKNTEVFVEFLKIFRVTSSKIIFLNYSLFYFQVSICFESRVNEERWFLVKIFWLKNYETLTFLHIYPVFTLLFISRPSHLKTHYVS